MTSLGGCQRPLQPSVSLAYKSENVVHGYRNLFVSNSASIDEGGWLGKRIASQLEKQYKPPHSDVGMTTSYDCVAVGCQDVVSGSESIYIGCLPQHAGPGDASQRQPVTAKDQEAIKRKVERLREMSTKTDRHVFHAESCSHVVAGQSCRLITVDNGYLPNGTTTKRPPLVNYSRARSKFISSGHSWSVNKPIVVGSGNFKVDLLHEEAEKAK